MKAINCSLLFVLVLSIPTAATAAAGSMLRVTCEGNNADAKVYVNGKFKGECPLDVQVPSGEVKLRATKSLVQDVDKVWEREISVGDGVVKKLEVILDEIQYSENIRQEYIKNSGSIHAKAEAGDAGSMVKFAEIYEQGIGVPKNYEKALKWYRKAADAGNADAMLKVGMYYNSGKGVSQSDEEAASWYKKAADKGNQTAIRLLKSLGR